MRRIDRSLGMAGTFNVHQSVFVILMCSATGFGAANLICIVFANAMMVFALGYSAMRAAPLMDEPAHFASGVVLAYQSDAGLFRVNPPANKWITAIAMLLAPEIKLPPVLVSERYSNRSRPEFDVGTNVMQLNRDTYIRFLIYARLARIPMMLFGSWLLFVATKSLIPSRRMLCQVLWCTSPLLLGHGWVVSADAPAAIAMCGILVTTLELWKLTSTIRFVFSGIAWGLAIGTKFTFGPLYLLFIPLFHVCSFRKRVSSDSANVANELPRSWAWYAGQWILHGLVACATLHTMYCFRGVGVPIGKHDFISQAFTNLRSDLKAENGSSAIKNWSVALPSPFPKVFLEGVDQQMADMDYPRGAYWMGERIPGKIRWFHFAGYFVKEQVAVWAATVLACLGLFIRKSRTTPVEDLSRRSMLQFCFLYLCGFSLFMMTQCNLVWNIRYLTPVLPLIYVVLAATLPAISITLPFRRKIHCSDAVVVGLVAVAITEFVWVFPHHFSYVNPLFGGSHRVPMALNDSNFDYGQDLFYARSWLRRQQIRAEAAAASARQEGRVYGVLSGFGRDWMRDILEPATQDLILSAVKYRKEKMEIVAMTTSSSPSLATHDLLIVSRGLYAAEPWGIRYSTLQDQSISHQSLCDLLTMSPDVFITPVVVGYWFEKEQQHLN